MIWSENDHDDGCDDSIGGYYDDVVGVSNIICDIRVEADAGVFFGVVATHAVRQWCHASLNHLQRRSVDIRQYGQHTHGVHVCYVRMPTPSSHSVGMSNSPLTPVCSWKRTKKSRLQ